MTQEQKHCFETLNDNKVWTCYHANLEDIKTFVSTAYDGLDFDGNFELHQIKTPFGQMVSVRKK